MEIPATLFVGMIMFFSVSMGLFNVWISAETNYIKRTSFMYGWAFSFFLGPLSLIYIFYRFYVYRVQKLT